MFSALPRSCKTRSLPLALHCASLCGQAAPVSRQRLAAAERRLDVGGRWTSMKVPGPSRRRARRHKIRSQPAGCFRVNWCCHSEVGCAHGKTGWVLLGNGASLAAKATVLAAAKP